MIFTLLCIKEFVKNFPFVNKNNPSSTEAKEAPTEGHTKDTKEKAPTEGHTEDHTEGPEKNDNT